MSTVLHIPKALFHPLLPRKRFQKREERIGEEAPQSDGDFASQTALSGVLSIPQDMFVVNVS